MKIETTSPKTESAAATSPEVERAAFTPNVDIVRGQDEVLIYADLPGTTADGIEVSFDRGMLQLQARVARRSLPGTPLREEYAVGDWRRSFTLSEEYDGSSTSAEYHEGVLCLRIPKAAQARAHRVQVRGGKG
jgi:HSP20 family molecular chaperone IbpA